MTSIRRERLEHIAAIRTVNEAAFGQNTEADIVDALRDACLDILSLAVESDGEIVGHITLLTGHGGGRVAGPGVDGTRPPWS
jgi:predicted N-acetyltransferase YhbS